MLKQFPRPTLPIPDPASRDLPWPGRQARRDRETSGIFDERDHYLPPDVVQDAQMRLSRVAGHVRALNRMLADGRDCADLLTQLIAVRAALVQVTVRLMDAHVQTCLRMIQRPEDQRQALERLRAALAAALGEKS